MSPHFRLFLIALALLSFAGPLLADEIEVSWEHPTERTDATPIAIADIARTEIRYAPCSSAVPPTLGTPVAVVSVPAPAKTTTIANLADGRWCVQARSIDTAGLASDWTGVAWRAARPKPPTLLKVMVVAVNGNYSSRPVYRVDDAGKLVNVSSRRVSVGAECDPAERAGTNYFSVAGQVNALKPSEPLPDGSFAYCVEART